MTATYHITTTNGREQTWIFTEYTDPADYGNGTYISVVRDNECLAYADMRYTHYVFTSFCVSYLRQWFGDNLLKVERV